MKRTSFFIKNALIRYIMFALLALTLLMPLACGPPELPSTGPKMPDISLPDLEGKTVRLRDYNGNVIMLNFWASWCPPCRKEIPDFIGLQDKFRKKGFTIIGVSLDYKERDLIRQFARDMKINYPVLYAGDLAKDVAEQMGGIRSIPTTFLINQEGRIVKKVPGALPKSFWTREIKSLVD